MIDLELIKAYQEARYVVQLHDRELVLRIGNKYSELADLMGEVGCDCAMFITPHNPASEQLSSAENEQRFQELLKMVRGLRSFKGYGVDDAEDWPREESLLVIGYDASQQVSLAHQFGQNAYVSINREGLLSLWIMAASDDPSHPSYKEYQQWGAVIASADTYSLLPCYSYPTFFDDGTKTPMQVVTHWRNNFERIVSLASGEFDAMTPVLECYAAWLIEQAKPAGYWCVLSDERMPSDARTDFIKTPTCIALATLVYLRNRLPKLASQQRKLDALITKVSRFIMRRRAWMGNGYDRHDAMCDFLDILGRAGVVDEWLAREQEFPELVTSLRGVAESMMANSGSWCGTEVGYSRINRSQLELATKALSPLLGKSLPVMPA